jgi:hypothetical protein
MAEAPSDMDPESEIEEDEDLRLAFRADGGRIGFRGGAAAASDAQQVEMQVEIQALLEVIPATGGGQLEMLVVVTNLNLIFLINR